jgi:hypothetical protein
MVVKGLIERDTGGHLALTDRGRTVFPGGIARPMTLPANSTFDVDH